MMEVKSNYDDIYNSQSKYCYPETDVLINSNNIRDAEVLSNVERMISTYKLSHLQVEPIKGNFDIDHYLKIHQYLFNDLYSFAGEIRTENMTKGVTPFCRPDYIHYYLTKTLEKLNQDIVKVKSEEELLDVLAYYYGEVNVIHPFREGNGRTQREFFREFVESKCQDYDFGNYEINYNQLASDGKTCLINGCILSAANGDTTLLKEFFKQTLVNHQKLYVSKR
ncbi:MAG: Fic family protein [Bacilli bacterium]|nr:Fic family protein [Bacilli bacterium]MDD4809438.1 Fic family protein [Bacilli bacterium]